MTNFEKARPIAALPKVNQVALMGEAARQTEPRRVKGNRSNRFYVGECRLSPAVLRPMREAGHGELVLMGNGSRSSRRYFPIEVLDRALALLAAGFEPKQ